MYKELVRVLPDFSSQNRQVAIFSDFFVILQSLILVRVQRFSKSLFFSPTRTHISKKPLFSMFLCWDVKILSQREEDVIKLNFDMKYIKLTDRIFLIIMHTVICQKKEA